MPLHSPELAHELAQDRAGALFSVRHAPYNSINRRAPRMGKNSPAIFYFVYFTLATGWCAFSIYLAAINY